MRSFLPRLLVLLMLATAASAHPVLQNSMWVLFEGDRVRVAVNVSLQELLVVQGIGGAPDDSYDAAAVNAAAEKHRDYVAAHLHLSVQGRELSGHVVALNPPPIFASAETTFFQYELEYPVTGPMPASIVFLHEMLREFPSAPGQPWDVSYLVRVKHQGSDQVDKWLLRQGQPSELPTGGEPVPTQVPQPVPGATGQRRPLPLWWIYAAILCAGLPLIFFIRRRFTAP